jgi:hypothetical protein
MTLLASIPTVDTALVPLMSYQILQVKSSTHRMCAQDHLFHKYGHKVFIDSQIPRIKYIYYINNVFKD